jgi:hypothetical protein
MAKKTDGAKNKYNYSIKKWRKLSKLGAADGKLRMKAIMFLKITVII